MDAARADRQYTARACRPCHEFGSRRGAVVTDPKAAGLCDCCTEKGLPARAYRRRARNDEPHRRRQRVRYDQHAGRNAQTSAHVEFFPAERLRGELRRQSKQYGSKRSEERRVGKECRSLCDWSSDVCSSDLSACRPQCANKCPRRIFSSGKVTRRTPSPVETIRQQKIGRASCRERV